MRAALEAVLPYAESRVEDMAMSAADQLGTGQEFRCACWMLGWRALADGYSACGDSAKAMREYRGIHREDAKREAAGLPRSDHPEPGGCCEGCPGPGT
jgi:hypothetical protein